MMTTMNGQPKTLILALAAAFLAACADPMTPDGNGLVPGSVSATVTHELFDFPVPSFPNPPGPGGVELCKRVLDLAPGGTFTFSVTSDGSGDFPFGNTVTLTVGAGGKECKTVYLSHVFNIDVETVTITENAPPAGWTLSAIDTRQLLITSTFNNNNYPPPRLDDAEDLANSTATLYINNDMARSVTFTNTFSPPPPPPPPPPPVCDFITFGRLVLEVNDLKVVISGNAGGNKPGGGILGEFHIEVNGTDHHVADISTYGPISSGPLSGLLNSRIVTGTDKDGHSVELRLWDGGEPGKGTDFVYINIDGVEWLGSAGAFIDMGNMQFHPVCRGPD
jgi:hypothetical protein